MLRVVQTSIDLVLPVGSGSLSQSTLFLQGKNMLFRVRLLAAPNLQTSLHKTTVLTLFAPAGTWNTGCHHDRVDEELCVTRSYHACLSRDERSGAGRPGDRDAFSEARLRAPLCRADGERLRPGWSV